MLHQVRNTWLIGVSLALCVLPICQGQVALPSIQTLPPISNSTNEAPAILPTVPFPSVEVLPATPTLGLAELEQLALRHHPGIAEALAQVNALRGKWEQVGLAPNPYAGYSGQQVGSGNTVEQRGVVFGQEFIRGKKLQLNQAVVSQEVRQAEQLLAVQQQRVLTDVRMAFSDALIAQRRVKLSSEIIASNTQAWELSQRRFAAKESSKTAVLQAKIELDSAQVQQRRALYIQQETWRKLTAVVGVPQLGMQPLQATDFPELPDYQWESTLAQLCQHSPEIAAAQAEIQRSRWAYQRAQAEKVSNLSFQGIVQDDRSIDAVNGSIQVTMPIPLWNKNQGGVKQAGHEALAAEQALQKLQLNLQHRLAGVLQRYQSAKYQTEQYAQLILPSAKENIELMGKSYQAGQSDYTDLLVAQRLYSQANVDYLNALQEARAIACEIDGLLLSNSLHAAR